MASSTDNTTTNTNCAACGKEGGNLNTCNKCKMVKYCNAACKKKHRSKHKKACERRVAELHDEALFKEHPPTDDCPICFLPLPIDVRVIWNSTLAVVKSSVKVVVMRYLEKHVGEVFKIGLCAFCRKPNPTSDEEEVERIQKQMEADNAYAFHALAGYYATGDHGMPHDMTKANELYLRGGELGCADSYCNLGISYDYGRGVDIDKKKAKHYWELATINGNFNARNNLGCAEAEAGNHHRAFMHFILAAEAGCKESLDVVKKGFMKGVVTKDGYANTLRAYQERYNEMKSDDRNKFAEALRQREEGM